MNTIITAIIAALSAILGAIVGPIVNYIIERLKYKTKETDNRKNIYINFINSMQNFMNFESESGFRQFQKDVNVILLYATSTIAKEVYEYYLKIIKKNENHILTPEEHCFFQNRIINLMRKDIDKNSDNIEEAKLIAFRPTKTNNLNFNEKE